MNCKCPQMQTIILLENLNYCSSNISPTSSLQMDGNLDEIVVVILAIILYSTSTLVLFPVEIYYLVRFCWHYGSHIIAKRRPGMSIMGMLFASTFYLLITAYSVWSWFNSHEVFGNTRQMAYLYPIAMTAWYIYIARIWLLFYSIKFNMESIKGKWQTIIDPDNKKYKKWFHSHRKLLGTTKSGTYS